ncbi:MAG: ferritin-like domain-containing protein [Gammaproteobacteria bacterium]|nr:ferritin-like domain-containing protein [Gammaproteobacteria bacterium]MBU1654779.1 ferritin-like domain-containing protein [Gammaproteobacteria bacterium]MBU1962652.1 ferritin-like domain-containing protein [Gammaproteobacteria bacterium]
MKAIDRNNLFTRARQCLLLSDPDEKVEAVKALYLEWRQAGLSTDPVDLPDVAEAGHPQRALRVMPRDLPKRGFHTQEGRAALIHALTHIEFSAINLHLDAVFRFRGMPPAFYDDWLRIAAEEVDHFIMLRGRLRQLGHDYGDFPVHLGLWETALDTAHDPLVRMAIIPRMLEARGLDVNPGMMDRFRRAGDEVTADALTIILRDEIGHVEAGSRWFHYLCEQRGLAPEETYFALLDRYIKGGVHCPLHREARLQAGFSPTEIKRLEALCARS